MKFSIKWKTPDVVEDALEQFACQCGGPNSCQDCEEKEVIQCEARELVKKFSNGEYIEIQFDTDTQTATVVKLTGLGRN